MWKSILIRNKFNIVCVIGLFILAYFPIFNNLGDFQIRMWDEAVYANNSIDMLNCSNPFVVEHLGEVDLYNNKPPLVIWMQATCMKVLGINELAVRLPSAIFSFFTILLIYFFCSKVLNNNIIGLLSAIILMTTKGFVANHVARTGDLDAVLVFWLTLGLFTFIHLVIKKPKNSLYHFLILTISITCGFLTKGIAGFFFIPFMFIILLLFDNVKIFKDKYLYISAITTLILCFSYYFIRELYTPGYLNLVYESEILRFNNEVMSWHVHPFDFYFQNLRTTSFDSFFYFLPIIILSLFILKSFKFRTSIYLLISAIGYFLLISYPKVKLEWYDAPLFPILSILLGLSFVELGVYIFKNLKVNWNLYLMKSVITLIGFILLFKPYKEILAVTKYPEESIYQMEFDGAYLKYLKKNKPEFKQITVFKREVHEEHYDQVLFYIRAYNMQSGYNIILKKEMDFKSTEIVMTSKQIDKDSIEKYYFTEKLNSWKNGNLYRIKGRKP